MRSQAKHTVAAKAAAVAERSLSYDNMTCDREKESTASTCPVSAHNEWDPLEVWSVSNITSLYIFIDDLLREVEKADLGIQLEGGKKVGEMVFADDFVGVSGSKEGLQKLALLEKCMGIICMCTIYGPSQ